MDYPQLLYHHGASGVSSGVTTVPAVSALVSPRYQRCQLWCHHGASGVSSGITTVPAVSALVSPWCQRCHQVSCVASVAVTPPMSASVSADRQLAPRRRAAVSGGSVHLSRPLIDKQRRRTGRAGAVPRSACDPARSQGDSSRFSALGRREFLPVLPRRCPRGCPSFRRVMSTQIMSHQRQHNTSWSPVGPR